VAGGYESSDTWSPAPPSTLYPGGQPCDEAYDELYIYRGTSQDMGRDAYVPNCEESLRWLDSPEGRKELEEINELLDMTPEELQEWAENSP
jgi:hypothetical protein